MQEQPTGAPKMSVKEFGDKMASNMFELREMAMVKMGITETDLKSLKKIPFFATFVSLFVTILILASITNFAWLEGTALADGQPFQAHLSLTHAIFGPPLDSTRDNEYFCGSPRCGNIPLKTLCETEVDLTSEDSIFENGMPKVSLPEFWCAAASAGGIVEGLLGFGVIPALVATVFTFLLASKDIAVTGAIYKKVEDMGLSETILKYVVCGCWAALWLFLFLAMLIYAAMVPDSLGWGTVRLEASFGILRFGLLLVSIVGAVLTSSLFELWHHAEVGEAVTEFLIEPWNTWKKAFYLELMLQLVLYFFLTIYTVDWAAVLIVLAGYYLDAKKPNFLIMYIVLVSISLVFDMFTFLAMPQFENMTPGESFGSHIWLFIAFLKPVIIGTIVMYEREKAEVDPKEAYNNLDDDYEDIAE